jgi:outer membrane murein-binding lipoprotein Lpp
MDLNQLLHDHQIAKVDHARAETRAERDGHAWD